MTPQATTGRFRCGFQGCDYKTNRMYNFKRHMFAVHLKNVTQSIIRRKRPIADGASIQEESTVFADPLAFPWTIFNICCVVLFIVRLLWINWLIMCSCGIFHLPSMVFIVFADVPAGDFQRYSCINCGKSYFAQTAFLYHIKFECEKLTAFSCTQCGKKFKRREHLTQHYRQAHLTILWIYIWQCVEISRLM